MTYLGTKQDFSHPKPLNLETDAFLIELFELHSEELGVIQELLGKFWPVFCKSSD